jgi:Family of unknown function (DUF6547)
MNKSLEEYQAFIDGLLEGPKSSIGARRAKEGVWNVNEVPQQEKVNKLLQELAPEQRETLAEMLQQEHDNGVFAVLAYLTDEIRVGGLRLVRNGIELAVEPYGTEIYYDWTCRRAGDAWPEHQLEEKYKF